MAIDAKVAVLPGDFSEGCGNSSKAFYRFKQQDEPRHADVHGELYQW